MSAFEIEGLDDWKQKLLSVANTEFPQAKQQELRKIGYMVQREIQLNVPVDTGRLRASINSQVQDMNTVVVGTNVDYAADVNYGHTQQKRFLPAKYLDTVKGRQYLGDGNNQGIMLKAKFVPGSHFMEKGLQTATPKVMVELDRWLDAMLRKFGE